MSVERYRYGETVEARTFVELHGPPSSEPLGRELFEDALGLVIRSELVAVGQDLIARLRELAASGAPTTRTLDHLTDALLAHLETHDCAALGHHPDACRERAHLATRVRRARAVFGLDT